MADAPRRREPPPSARRLPKVKRSAKPGRATGPGVAPEAASTGAGAGAGAGRTVSPGVAAGGQAGGGQSPAAASRGASAGGRVSPGGASAGGAKKPRSTSKSRPAADFDQALVVGPGGAPAASPASVSGASPASASGASPASPASPARETYAGAGVDIAAGEAAVDRIRRKVRSTFRPEVISDIGGFGGLFAFDPARYRKPVLVSSTDSVGTKALIARQTGRLDTIGIDLVAMVVDDIAAQGAEPLFFLDCISVGKLNPAEIDTIVGGIVKGCRRARCSLVGGEMAEVPGMLEVGAFDLVGFGVGVVERSRLITGESVEPGDRIIGLPSPGLRSNGYTLARRVLFDRAGLTLDSPAWPDAGHTLADELLRPSVIYAPALVALCAEIEVRALAHITGGGLPGNIPRVLPDNVDAVIHRSTWDVPEIFYQLRDLGPISTDEMTAVFNLGIGMVAVVAPEDVTPAMGVLQASGLAPVVIGEIVPGHQEVHFA